MGLAAIFSFSSSASCSLFAFALLFWNQILTCVSVKLRELENSARSAMDRYCFWRNFLSSARSWDVVNGVLGFLLVLCFLRGQAGGLSLLGGGGENRGLCIQELRSCLSGLSDLTSASSCIAIIPPTEKGEPIARGETAVSGPVSDPILGLSA